MTSPQPRAYFPSLECPEAHSRAPRYRSRGCGGVWKWRGVSHDLLTSLGSFLSLRSSPYAAPSLLWSDGWSDNSRTSRPSQSLANPIQTHRRLLLDQCGHQSLSPISFGCAPQFLAAHSEMLKTRLQNSFRSSLSMIAQLRSMVAIRFPFSASRQRLRGEFQQHLAKLLRAEEPTASQSRMNRQFELALSLRIDCSRLAPDSSNPHETPAFRETFSAHRVCLCTRSPKTPSRFPASWAASWELRYSGANCSTGRIPDHRLLGPTGAHRIKVNVIKQRPKTVSRLNQNRFIASSEYMPPKPVPGVDPPSKSVLQPAHASGKIGLLRLQQQVIVVASSKRRRELEIQPAHTLRPAFAPKCCGPHRPAQWPLAGPLAPSHDTSPRRILSVLVWASAIHAQIRKCQ